MALISCEVLLGSPWHLAMQWKSDQQSCRQKNWQKSAVKLLSATHPWILLSSLGYTAGEHALQASFELKLLRGNLILSTANATSHHLPTLNYLDRGQMSGFCTGLTLSTTVPIMFLNIC